MSIEGILIIFFIMSWISGAVSILIGFIQMKKFRKAAAVFHPAIKTTLVPSGDVSPKFLMQWGKRVGMLLLFFGTRSQSEQYLQLFMDTATIRQNENREVNNYLNRVLFCISWFAASFSLCILSLAMLLTITVDI